MLSKFELEDKNECSPWFNSYTEVNTSLIRIYTSLTQVRHESKQINASATRISRSLKGVNTSNLGSLLHLTSFH